jgi:hypothetical protein
MRKNIALIPSLICRCTRNSIRRGICPINRANHAAIKLTAIRPKFACRGILYMLVAGKTENGYPFPRKRWSVIETIPTAAITSALLHQPLTIRRILFSVLLLAQERRPFRIASWPRPFLRVVLLQDFPLLGMFCSRCTRLPSRACIRPAPGEMARSDSGKLVDSFGAVGRCR